MNLFTEMVSFNGGWMEKNINLMGKKILVTGASGFIGSHLCRRLIAMGSKVVGVSRKDRQYPKTSTCWLTGDVSQPDSVKKIFETAEPEIVFHMASHVVGARNVELVIPTFHDNLASTVNILLEAKRLGCKKVVMIGSLEEPENQNGRLIPSSPYAAAKSAATAYCRMFHALYGTPVTIARLFMVYGPAQRDLNKLIPFVILSLLKKEIPSLSSGKRLVDWIYVEDVVDALVRMAHAKDLEGETIDIGSGELHSVQSVVLKISELVDPSLSIIFGDLADRAFEQVRMASIEETFLKIGWKPTTTLAKGLEETVKWYRDMAEN
jgi:UDP-glucose 4-epimerase